MHYLLLRGWKQRAADSWLFASVIFDEIQELRHARHGKVLRRASLLSESCERVIGLSGTPIYNRGGEIWNVVNILDYHCLRRLGVASRASGASGYGNQLVLRARCCSARTCGGRG